MFQNLIFNKKIKYIGYTIVFIMVAIPIGIFFNSLYEGITHMFGGETKDEKITRLTTNETVLKQSIKSVKKSNDLIVKKTKVLTKIIIKSTDKKVIIKKDLVKRKVNLIKKIKIITHRIKKDKTNVIKKKIANVKIEPIVIINDDVKYKQIGVLLSDSMFNMYDKTMEVK